MKVLIEYLLLFIVIALFCPNNYFTLAYCISSILACLVYLIAYLKLSKNNKNSLDKQVDANFLLILIMIVVINLIVKLEITNLIFGVATFIIFVVNSILILTKKDLNYKLIKSSRLFDFYSLIYLSSLVIMVLSYEF